MPTNPTPNDQGTLLPCPFCGRAPSADLSDSLYPSGGVWTDIVTPGEPTRRAYHSRKNVTRFDGECWQLCCPASEGGCDAEVHGDSRDEAIAAWNRRAALARLGGAA